jgi:hypothetical protein
MPVPLQPPAAAAAAATMQEPVLQRLPLPEGREQRQILQQQQQQVAPAFLQALPSQL